MKQLTELSKEDLAKRLVELKKEMMKQNAQISTGTPPENPGRVKMVKRTIARIKTIERRKTK